MNIQPQTIVCLLTGRKFEFSEALDGTPSLRVSDAGCSNGMTFNFDADGKWRETQTLSHDVPTGYEGLTPLPVDGSIQGVATHDVKITIPLCRCYRLSVPDNPAEPKTFENTKPPGAECDCKPDERYETTFKLEPLDPPKE